ncbi:MAG: hypothetical protein ACKOEM_06480, partial [Planctomycetia bacterium]
MRGYCRIDAFVRIFEQSTGPKVEVLIIELNSLPGMTPATCIFHQCALQGYKPDEFIRQILAEGRNRNAAEGSNRNAAEGRNRNATGDISRNAAEGISRKAAGGR